MNILLILPATPAYRVTASQSSVPRRALLRFSLLPLTTVAALTPPEHRVTILDENVQPLDFDFPADLAGISFMTAYAPRAYEIAAEFRRRGVPVVAGGYHPTLCPDDAIPRFDHVIQGDAEELWPRLLEDLAAGKARRVYRHETPPARLDSPPPRRELTVPQARHYGTIHAVQTSRGCLHGCRFCSVTRFHRQTCRHKPLDQVLSEVRSAPRHFMFVDDNLIADPGYARQLFEALIPLKKKWVSQCTLRIADDPELLALAKRAGCLGLFVGLESLSAENLHGLAKDINNERSSQERLQTIRRAGIGVQTAVITGLDQDGPEVFRQTLRFLLRNRVDALQLSILTPLPGTPLYEEMERAGRICDRDWAHYDFRHVVFRPARLSPEELQAGADWLYHQFYRLDRIMLRSLRAFRLAGLTGAVFCLRLNLTYRYDNRRERIVGWDPGLRQSGIAGWRARFFPARFPWPWRSWKAYGVRRFLPRFGFGAKRRPAASPLLVAQPSAARPARGTASRGPGIPPVLNQASSPRASSVTNIGGTPMPPPQRGTAVRRCEKAIFHHETREIHEVLF